MGELENNIKDLQHLTLVKILKNGFSSKDNVTENVSFQTEMGTNNSY